EFAAMVAEDRATARGWRLGHGADRIHQRPLGLRVASEAFVVLFAQCRSGGCGVPAIGVVECDPEMMLSGGMVAAKPQGKPAHVESLGVALPVLKCDEDVGEHPRLAVFPFAPVGEPVGGFSVL